jgi:hypothetical protein
MSENEGTLSFLSRHDRANMRQRLIKMTLPGGRY